MIKLPVIYRATIDRHVPIVVRSRSERVTKWGKAMSAGTRRVRRVV